ncbi:MAG: alpha/beta fold hydrolase [Rhizobiaceae bacterium]
MSPHFVPHDPTDTAPIVALHASASGERQWRALNDSLDDRFIVVAPNLPGYGSNTVSGMGVVAKHITLAIEKLGEPVHLVGHSFGGCVALKIAMQHSRLVKSMTLFEPAAFHLLSQTNCTDSAALDDLKRIELELRSNAANGQSDSGMSQFVDFWAGNGVFECLSASKRNALAAMSQSVIADIGNCFAETWTSQQLARLEMPVQILMGLESPNLAQRASTLVFEAITQAELVMLPGLGHMAPIDSPDWVNPRIQQHIARVERSASHFGWPRRRAA